MQSLEPAVQDRVSHWLNGNYDNETKNEIKAKLSNKKYEALTDAFYRDLEFGTGGIRGIMGVGPNRVNKYTFGMAAQGFSNFLKKNHPDEDIKVAVAYDCRNNSSSLAQVVADIFSANGIKVYLFEHLRPTPELSFAIRELNCQGGVMLTASHNPKEYNGFKAYGADGGQLVAPQDRQVMEEVHGISDVNEIKFDGDERLIESIGKSVDEKYLEAIAGLSVSGDAIKRQKDLEIVFSPIHGTAGVLMPDALKRYGFENVTFVEEQMTFDGNFPTVEYPNPEEKAALALALEKALEIDADLVMATDPDADRVGIAVKDAKEKWVLLNGNQVGSLIINYMLDAWKQAGKLNGNEYVVKTIVTSYLIDRLARYYGVECYNTLTGFKYIGELMTRLEGQKQFIAGGEESYGYLIGEHVRDKDAIVSAAIIAEMTAFYKDKGSSLYEALIDIYLKHGYFRERLVSVYKKGKKGAEEIQQIMKRFRENPPSQLGGSKIATIKDYKTQETKHIKTGEVSVIDLPTSNVLQFITEDESIVSVRPSGTEPKIKFYCSVNGRLESKDDFARATVHLENKIDSIMSDLAV